MKRIAQAAALACASYCSVGCGKNIQNEASVRAAIEKRLVKTGFTPEKMSVDIKRVTFHDDEAQATVSFVPKEGPAGGGVTFKYNLRREKDEWVVTGPATGESAAGHSGMGAAGAGARGTNPGPVDPGAPLPSGHPPVGSKP